MADELVTTAATAAPWWPTAAWLAALKAEITPETMAYTRSYAQTLLRAGGAAMYCDDSARALAHEALSDTALGFRADRAAVA